MLVVSDVLNMMDSGVLILFANSCRTQGWRPSGPGDLKVFSFFNFCRWVDSTKFDCLGTSYLVLYIFNDFHTCKYNVLMNPGFRFADVHKLLYM